MASLYENYLGIFRDAPPEQRDPTERKAMWQALERMEKIISDSQIREKQAAAKVDAQRLQAQVKLAGASSDLLRSIASGVATRDAATIAAAQRNLDSIRDAVTATWVTDDSLTQRVLRVGDSAAAAAGANQQAAVIGRGKAVVGALDQAGQVTPGSPYAQPIVADFEQKTGVAIGSPEFDTLFTGAPDERARLVDLKKAAQNAETIKGQQLDRLDALAKATVGMRPGAPLDPRTVQEVQERLRALEEDVRATTGTTGEKAQAAYQEKVEELESYKRQTDTAEQLKTRLLGDDEASSSVKEQIAKLVMKPKFRHWAAQYGYDKLGQAQFDENGKMTGYLPGAHDAYAVMLFRQQLRHGQKGTLFARGTGRWVRVPVQTVDVGALRDAEGNFATVADPATGERRYLSPADREDYEADRGARPEVELLGMPDGKLYAKVGDHYFLRGVDGLWTASEAPAEEPAQRAHAVYVQNGEPVRYARAHDFDAPVGDVVYPADDAAKAAIETKLPAPEQTKEPPPAGAAWVIGREHALRAGDLKYETLDPQTGLVASRPIRVLGRTSAGQRGMFLVDSQGNVLESPATELPGAAPGEVVLEARPRGLGGSVQQAAAELAARQAERALRERPEKAVVVTGAPVGKAEEPKARAEAAPAAGTFDWLKQVRFPRVLPEKKAKEEAPARVGPEPSIPAPGPPSEPTGPAPAAPAEPASIWGLVEAQDEAARNARVSRGATELARKSAEAKPAASPAPSAPSGPGPGGGSSVAGVAPQRSGAGAARAPAALPEGTRERLAEASASLARAKEATAALAEATKPGTTAAMAPEKVKIGLTPAQIEQLKRLREMRRTVETLPVGSEAAGGGA